MNKIKILFVVVNFYKGGAERFAYEIDKALDKSKFEVTIYCHSLEKEENLNWERYYHKEHKKIGTEIIYSDNYRRKQSNSTLKRILKRGLKLKSKSHIKEDKIINLFNQYDLVHFMGEYTVPHFLPKKILDKSVIYSMSAKFQNSKLYDKFDFNYKYNFISTFYDNELEVEFGDFKKINHWFFPLVFEIKNNKPNWTFYDHGVKKVGIFTRLDRYKPLDPFIYSFQLLLEKLPNAELHIFGTGDPEIEGINRYIRHLGLTSKIFFRGHQDDIVATAINEKIGISWFQGYNNSRPLGYGGLDICAAGIPLICWDFYEKPIISRNEIFPHFKNLNSFVDESVGLLTNKEEATKISIIRLNEVKETRNSVNRIKEIENIYLEIINK